MNLDQERADFETLALQLHKAKRAAGDPAIDDTPDLDPTAEALFWRTDDGLYGVKQFNAAWWAWRMRAEVARAVERNLVDALRQEVEAPTFMGEPVGFAPAVPQIYLSDELHPATSKLVLDFAQAFGEKLLEAQRKYGYTDGWRSPLWIAECRTKLVEHVEKGDPLDVAAYCAFLWHHKAPTIVQHATANFGETPFQQPVPEGCVPGIYKPPTDDELGYAAFAADWAERWPAGTAVPAWELCVGKQRWVAVGKAVKKALGYVVTFKVDLSIDPDAPLESTYE